MCLTGMLMGMVWAGTLRRGAAMENLQFYLVIIVPAAVALGLFGLLRRRDTQPVVAGCAASALAIALVALYFVVVILS